MSWLWFGREAVIICCNKNLRLPPLPKTFQRSLALRTRTDRTLATKFVIKSNIRGLTLEDASLMTKIKLPYSFPCITECSSVNRGKYHAMHEVVYERHSNTGFLVFRCTWRRLAGISIHLQRTNCDMKLHYLVRIGIPKSE